MARRIILWRIELSAGVAAAAVGLLTLPMALFAPLYPVCAIAQPAHKVCPDTAIRAVSLLATHPAGDVWALLLGLLALTLVGAAGAIADARTPPDPGAKMVTGAGMLALWGATLALLAICVLGSRGALGVLYLPSFLALALAAYVAVLRRLAARRAASAPGD